VFYVAVGLSRMVTLNSLLKYVNERLEERLCHWNQVDENTHLAQFDIICWKNTLP
jgi:hypothetical protein